MGRILQVFYVIFSAFILSLAIQNELLPFGSPFLGLFALTPLYIAIRNSRSYTEAALLTGLQTGLVHLLSSFWLGNFRDFAVFTLGASALGTSVIGMVFGCYLYLPLGMRQKERSGCISSDSSVAWRVFLFAAVWTIYEWAKSNGFLAYPWGTLVMTAYKWPLITQIAAVTGTWGISFLFALFSAIVAEGLSLVSEISRGNRTCLLASYCRCAAVCIILFATTCVYGVVEYTKERVPVKTMQTVLVQQNQDSWGSKDSEIVEISSMLTTQAVDECMQTTGEKPDLIVWSEAVLSYAFPEAESYYSRNPSPVALIPFIKETGVPFIIGAPVTIDKVRRQYGNSALYFSKNGDYKGYYSKMHLVPFAEVIPGMEYEFVRTLLRKVVGISSGWTPGTELTLFDVPLNSGGSVRISTPICFEDAFPATCGALFKAGSEVFVNITNDSWSLTNSAEYQHFVIASYRAIEYRTTLVRSTNSGYSVVLDPAGRIVADMPLFTAASIYTPVPIYGRTATVYSILGDWVPALCGAVYFIYIVLVCRRKEQAVTTNASTQTLTSE